MTVKAQWANVHIIKSRCSALLLLTCTNVKADFNYFHWHDLGVCPSFHHSFRVLKLQEYMGGSHWLYICHIMPVARLVKRIFLFANLSQADVVKLNKLEMEQIECVANWWGRIERSFYTMVSFRKHNIQHMQGSRVHVPNYVFKRGTFAKFK